MCMSRFLEGKLYSDFDELQRFNYGILIYNITLHFSNESATQSRGLLASGWCISSIVCSLEGDNTAGGLRF